MEPIKQSQSLDTPLYSIPAEVAKRNNTSHQVLPGKPAAYTHKVSTPKYMDTQENPYAVFVFQYRDTEIIETMMKVTIEEPADVEKQRMASLTKDELVEELMRLKEKEKSGSQVCNIYLKFSFMGRSLSWLSNLCEKVHFCT